MWKLSSSTLFLFFLLFTSTLSTHQNYIELIDQLRSGKEILNTIFTELHSSGSNLQMVKLLELLKTSKDNAAKTKSSKVSGLSNNEKSCKIDSNILNSNPGIHSKVEFTLSNTLSSNKHDLWKNRIYVERSKAEYEIYESLNNLVQENKNQFIHFINDRKIKLTQIIKLLRRSRQELINIQMVSKDSHIIEIKPSFITTLTNLEIVLNSSEDQLEGLRPIVTSLLETMKSTAIKKSLIRSRIIKLLHSIIKSLHQKKDDMEQIIEGASAIYEALSKRFEENKSRLSKSIHNLTFERTILKARHSALLMSLRRAQRFSFMTGKTTNTRQKKCYIKKRRIKGFYISFQKVKSIVGQIEEILQERYGALKAHLFRKKLRIKGKYKINN
jgi:hypothetical protein